MADRQLGVWGIDLGQCGLKAIRLENIDGQITATAFDYVEHPKILSQPDADPDQLTREALEKFLSRNTLRGDVVAVGVPGQSGLARFVKLPPVEEKKIPDIVRFEAKQQIPFPLDEVVWDFQKIGSGAVTDGFALETEIGLFALKRDTVNRALQHFADVKVEVHVVQMTPLALCNFVAFDLLGKDAAPGEAGAGEEDDDQKRCIVALDIGTDNSNLVVTDAGKIIWQRPIPFGGNHFTRALTKDLKLTFAKAEHLKRNATKSPDLKKILAALKPVLNDFVGEVQRSLGYFTNTHRNAQIEYMVGLGNAFRLPGLQKFLSEKLQLELRKIQKFERMAGDTVINAPSFTQNVLSFATAYGLALQGLKLTHLQTNLLPQEIQFERMVRAKKPWAVSAAAALLLGVLATTIQYALQYHAVAASSVVNAMDAGQKVVTKAKDDNQAFETKKAEISKKEDDVRKIIEGQEERLDWMLLNRFVNECLPVPGYHVDGKIKDRGAADYVILDAEGKSRKFNYTETLILANGQPAKEIKPGDEVTVIYNELPPSAKQYWTRQAQDSYLKLWERQAAGKGGASGGEDEGVDHLIQVNVEAINSLYSTDLKSYWNQVKSDVNGQKLSGMREDDKKNPPEGKGWVIELRGYTYHQGKYQFLIDTLLQNLTTRALKKKDDAPKEGEGKPAETKSSPAPAAGGKDNPSAATNGDAKQDKKDPQKEAAIEKEELWDRVINNKISHAFLYTYKPSYSLDDPAHFEVIGSSVLGSLVNEAAPSGGQGGGAGAMGGVGGGGVMGGGGGGGRSSSSGWTPLTSSGVGGGGGGGRQRAGGDGGAGPAAGPRGGINMTQGKEQPAPEKKGAGPVRTEFIMLFIWKEPTPSDDRNGTPETK